jgi:hypothetical protein
MVQIDFCASYLISDLSDFDQIRATGICDATNPSFLCVSLAFPKVNAL